MGGDGRPPAQADARRRGGRAQLQRARAQGARRGGGGGDGGARLRPPRLQLQRAPRPRLRGQLQRDVQRVSGRPRQHVRRQDHQMLRELRGVRGEAGAGAGAHPGGDHERVPVSFAGFLAV